jgi:Flp pilus assembly CpaE family ATPase
VGAVLVVAGPPGSPGRTTLAVNLAAALGGAAATALVAADAGAPSVGAALALDLSRNACMVAHADPASGRDWDRAFAEELQPLHPDCAHGVVLCGAPTPELRGALTVPFLERLVGQLRRRHRHVVLDTGPELLGPGGALHRAALALADRVVLAAGPDVVSLWRARTALGLLREQLGLDPACVSVVVNRHDERFHHRRAEIEENLGLRLAALVPFDHAGAERALGDVRPMALDGGSKAGFYLLELAGRVHGARLDPPPEPRPAGRRRWVLGLP